MKPELSPQISEKYSNNKRQENPSSETAWQMNRHDEANRSFPQFCKRT